MGLKEGKSLKVVSPVKELGKPANYVTFKTLVWVSRIQLSLFIMIIVFTIYYVRNMCIPSQSSYVEALNAIIMVFEGMWWWSIWEVVKVECWWMGLVLL